MAYENLDVSRARTAINQCLSSLKYNASTNIISELKKGNIWEADSKTTFVNAVDTLVNTRYKELKDYLNQCLKALDGIEKYKTLQSQNASYDAQINNKNYELNIYKNKYRNMTDKTTTEAKELDKKITKLEKDINDLKSKKSNNSGDMVDINKTITI